jgi:hypothetical protein
MEDQDLPILPLTMDKSNKSLVVSRWQEARIEMEVWKCDNAGLEVINLSLVGVPASACLLFEHEGKIGNSKSTLKP